VELVRDELSISNLNFEKLYTKLVSRSWVFFAAVVLYQLPAALIRHDYGPRIVTDAASRNYTIPISASWLYVPYDTVLRMDDNVASAWATALRNNDTCDGLSGGWSDSLGWGGGAVWAWKTFTGR